MPSLPQRGMTTCCTLNSVTAGLRSNLALLIPVISAASLPCLVVLLSQCENMLIGAQWIAPIDPCDAGLIGDVCVSGLRVQTCWARCAIFRPVGGDNQQLADDVLIRVAGFQQF